MIERLRRVAIPDAAILLLERQDAPAVDGLDAVPPRTVVRLALTPAPGSRIIAEIWLPDAAQWSGRLVGLGNGGAAGGIPTGWLAERLRAGHAAATTDLGTAHASDSGASGIGNREVWRDFGHRATHLMTVVAKLLITAAYGRGPDSSYFIGQSTGGQQAMQEAQRHPGDYDAIAARVPAHCRAPLHAYFLWNHQILSRCPFTEAQQAAVIQAANLHFTGMPPDLIASPLAPRLAARCVPDPRCTPDDIAAVIRLARAADASLTDAHAHALRQLFSGPIHAVTGERIHDGIPLGASWNHATANLYLFRWVFGADVDLLRLDFAADIERYLAELGPDLNAEDDDLSAFQAHGGKLLLITGSADAVVPYHATLDYYERLCARAGSLEAVAEFCRLYLVPGMAHSDDGPGITHHDDLLPPLIAWREQGISPGPLPCRRMVAGKSAYELAVPVYPARLDGTSGPRGGVGRVAERFRIPPRIGPAAG